VKSVFGGPQHNPRNPRNPRKYLAGFVLVLMPILAYYPAKQGDFIWDDDDWVWDNPLVTGEHGYFDIWFSRKHPSQYFPMVYTTFRLEHQLFGLEPFIYHVTNIILHALSATMLWCILIRLRLLKSAP
jgi:hypothetical protein